MDNVKIISPEPGACRQRLDRVSVGAAIKNANALMRYI
jgi:hypothetical protein